MAENYEGERNRINKLISEARAEGISPEEEKELDALISRVDASFEKLRGAQDSMEKTFFELVGKAISMWANIETILIAIAGLLLRTSLKKVGVVLYSIQNFHVWLNIIDELLSIDIHLGEYRSRWIEISDKVRPLNDTRVRLAHHTFFHDQSDASNPSLKPGRFDARQKSKTYKPLEMEKIVEFMEQLNDAQDSLKELMNAMRARLVALRGKSAPPPADQPPEGSQ